MIFSENFKIGLKDIGKENYIKNRAILEILENIGTHHSDLAGYGPNDIQRTGVSWVLLDWKLKVLKRPKYGQTLKVNTWGRTMKRAFTYREFEIYDTQGNLYAIATSKWALININTGKVIRLTDEILEKYQLEEKSVFKEDELGKIDIPKDYQTEIQYKIARRDIDINGHMHNLYYLDLAYEALPQNVYEKRPFSSVRIQYKKELKLGDKVKCKYTFEKEEHIITIWSENEKTIHSIIKLK